MYIISKHCPQDVVVTQTNSLCAQQLGIKLNLKLNQSSVTVACVK